MDIAATPHWMHRYNFSQRLAVPLGSPASAPWPQTKCCLRVDTAKTDAADGRRFFALLGLVSLQLSRGKSGAAIDAIGDHRRRHRASTFSRSPPTGCGHGVRYGWAYVAVVRRQIRDHTFVGASRLAAAGRARFHRSTLAPCASYHVDRALCCPVVGLACQP